MIKAEKSLKPGQYAVNLSDEIVEEIDNFAIGMFKDRADFLLFAVRDFTRQIHKKTNRYEKSIYDTTKDLPRAIQESQDKIDDYLSKVKRRADKFYSKDMSQITLYVTEMQFKELSLFFNERRALKNLQDFARAAAVWELDEMSQLSSGYIDL